MHRKSLVLDRRSVVVVFVATLVALTLPLSLALATSAFGQEPEPPTGEPQDPPPEEPGPTPEEPTPQEPTGEAPTGEAPAGGGGTLPRTGWETALYLVLGVGLLLAGARLRVVARIKEVVERVRRRNTEVALREALEPIRAARMSPPSPDPDPDTPLHVEPSTPTAKRLTGVTDGD